MLVVLAIAALAILACVVLVSLGRGGELTEFPPDVPPLDLPEPGQLTAVDFMALQLPVNLVGYHTQSVDETLRRAASAISARDSRIAVLEQRVSELLASRLQARQEAYAAPGAEVRTEHRPEVPAVPRELPEDGDPQPTVSVPASFGHDDPQKGPSDEPVNASDVAEPSAESADVPASFGGEGAAEPLPASDWDGAVEPRSASEWEGAVEPGASGGGADDTRRGAFGDGDDAAGRGAFGGGEGADQVGAFGGAQGEADRSASLGRAEESRRDGTAEPGEASRAGASWNGAAKAGERDAGPNEKDEVERS